MLFSSLFSRVRNARDWITSMEVVDQPSSHTASNNSNVRTCVNILADDIAKLPIHTFKNADRKQGYKHPVARLLNGKANPIMTSFIWKRTMQYCLGMYGNAYSQIEWGKDGRPKALWILPPDAVVPRVDENKNFYYEVSTSEGLIRLEPPDVLHFREPSATGLVGVPPWASLVHEINSQEEAKRFINSFYRNGARLSGVLHTESKLDGEAKEKVRQEWMKKYSGSANAGSVAVLDLGLRYESIGMPLESAQFIQTQKFGINEVAKVYKVPPHKLAQMDNASYANTEAMGIEYIKTALLPIFTQWEQEINTKLFSEKEQAEYYVKFNANAELRGDSTARANYFGAMINNGVYSINEVRDMEERESIGEAGNKHYMSLNYTTLDALEEYQLAKVGAKKGGEEDDEGKAIQSI